MWRYLHDLMVSRFSTVRYRLLVLYRLVTDGQGSVFDCLITKIGKIICDGNSVSAIDRNLPDVQTTRFDVSL